MTTASLGLKAVVHMALEDFLATDFIGFFDFISYCRQRTPMTAEIAENGDLRGLMVNGTLHGSVRKHVLALVTGEGENMVILLCDED